MTPYKSYAELESENASLRAQLAQSNTIADSYAAEMREESLERDLILWALDEPFQSKDDGESFYCAFCGAWELDNGSYKHEPDCLHLRAKAYRQSQKENGQ